MKKVVVFGGDGVGMSIASIVELDDDAVMMGFINDNAQAGEMIGQFKKYPVLGDTSIVKELLADDEVFFTFAYTAMKHAEHLYKKIQQINIPKDRLYSAIHPKAIIPEGFCKIGRGVVLYANAQVGPDAIMDDYSMLFANTYLGHNSYLGPCAHLAAGSTVGAHVKIGKFTHIGLNALVKEHVTVGDYALIGAGAVVLKDVSDRSIVIGNPARVLRQIEEQD